MVGLAGVALTVGLIAFPTGADSKSAGPEPDARGGVITGLVEVDGEPVRGATVDLYRAGERPGDADRFAAVTTDRLGRFNLRVPPGVGGQLYLTSRHGRVANERLPDAAVLATALGGRRSGQVVVNEATTVASGFSLAQFAEHGVLGGANPGLSNAMRMVRNFVTIRTGATSRFLRQAPNGTSTQTLASFNSLASIIGGCATGRSSCGAFLTAATDAWGHRPSDTWEAMSLLPKNPSGDPDGVFEAVPAKPGYRPVLQDAPAAWVLALQFVGNGHEFNGPGNVAFDKDGAVWTINNAEWAVKLKNVCPGLGLFKLDPFSAGRPLDQYFGGGINGAGFGVGFAPNGKLWVANFGFTGTKCPTAPTSNSVSEFHPDGRPISPPKGYRQGPLSWPQGTKSDRDGNIWIANCGNSSVVRYPDGDQHRSEVIATGVGRAFDVAFNTEGNAFVTANEANQVFGFDPEGNPLPGSPYGDSSVFSLPLGIASDRLGNTWVSNSGKIPSPCKSGQVLDPPAGDAEPDGSIVQVGPDGSLTRYVGAGLTIPWGIAVDGDDNIWVANFSGQRLSHLCGDRAATCPTGEPGDPISPSTGYPFDGLQRNTGVQVDPSGNVWLTNNWKKIPAQVNPFGRGLVAYIGMAPPVRAPLIGPPRLP